MISQSRKGALWYAMAFRVLLRESCAHAFYRLRGRRHDGLQSWAVQIDQSEYRR